jgi:hypothetical protein
MRTIKIELRYDFDNEEKDEIMRDAARMAAKHLFTTAALVSDRRPPEIMLQGDNFFEGKYEISLAEDLE